MSVDSYIDNSIKKQMGDEVHNVIVKKHDDLILLEFEKLGYSKEDVLKLIKEYKVKVIPTLINQTGRKKYDYYFENKKIFTINEQYSLDIVNGEFKMSCEVYVTH